MSLSPDNISLPPGFFDLAKIGHSSRYGPTRGFASQIVATSSRPELRARMESQLDAQECELVALRFGLDDGRPKTLREVERRLGIARGEAGVIELRAISKLGT